MDECKKDVESCRAAARAAPIDENMDALLAAANRLKDAQNDKSAAERAALTLANSATSARLGAVASATVPAATSLIATSVTALAGSDQAFQRLFNVTGVGSMSQEKAVSRYRAALSASQPALLAAIMSSPVEILQHQAVCAALTTVAFTFWVSEQAYSPNELLTARLQSVTAALRAPIQAVSVPDQVKTHLEALAEQRKGEENMFERASSVLGVCEPDFRKFILTSTSIEDLGARADTLAAFTSLARRFVSSQPSGGRSTIASVDVSDSRVEALHLQVAALRSELASRSALGNRINNTNTSTNVAKEMCYYCFNNPALKANASGHSKASCIFGYTCKGCAKVGSSGNPVGHKYPDWPLRSTTLAGQLQVESNEAIHSCFGEA